MGDYPNLNKIFINERLKRRLNTIHTYPITTIIAPMGYGKTTAIKWWLDNSIKKHTDAIVLRQTVSTDSITDFWTGLCKTLKNYPTLAEQMKALGYPEDANSRTIFTELLEDAIFDSPNPIVLIIDDVHLIAPKKLVSLLVFLSRTMSRNLCIILLSRNQIFTEEEKMRLGNLLCEITIGDLRLRESEVDLYAKLCGLEVMDDELKELVDISEGWISMVYLNFKSYVQNRTWLYHSENILALINQVMLDPLPESSRQFLILLGMTNEFTKEQAVYLWRNPSAFDLLEDLTKNNAFISKNENGIYRYHNMLQQCTRQKFSEKPESYQKMNYSRLGHWHLDLGDYAHAYEAFYRANDWDGVFMTIEKDRFNSFNKEKYPNISLWLKECPEEIILKYPAGITSCMIEMFVINDISELKRMKTLLLKSLEGNKTLTEDEKNNLLGDAEVAESFLFYNDISAMSVCHRRAIALLNRPTLSIDQKGLWTFSSPSIFASYHRTAGKADEENKEMKECMPYYYQVSDGHGSGAEYGFQAELFYERGEIIDADISNRMAMIKAELKDQFSIIVCSKILSMRMAIFNGTWDAIEDCSVNYRKKLIFEKQYSLVYTLDSSLSYIYALLGHPESAPRWLLEGGLSDANIMFPALPMFNVFYNQLLLAKEEWVQVVARRDECAKINDVHSNVMCQIWLQLQQATALEKLNKHEEAVMALSEALHMAVPDGIVMPFVESEVYIGPLLKEIGEKSVYMETIDYILYLSKKFRKGKEKIVWEHWNEYEKHDLSQREFVIAKLAAQRKTNVEIAEELHLATGTVRNHLSCIYAKLNITGSVKNKRNKLEELLRAKT